MEARQISGSPTVKEGLASPRTQMERLQCYEGIGHEDALGKFDRALQDQYLRMGADHTDVKEWPRLREQIYTLGFFSLRPLFALFFTTLPVSS